MNNHTYFSAMTLKNPRKHVFSIVGVGWLIRKPPESGSWSIRGSPWITRGEHQVSCLPPWWGRHNRLEQEGNYTNFQFSWFQFYNPALSVSLKLMCCVTEGTLWPVYWTTCVMPTLLNNLEWTSRRSNNWVFVQCDRIIPLCLVEINRCTNNYQAFDTFL